MTDTPSSSTPDGQPNTAADAIDRVLELLRRELHDNPELAYRLVRALGAQVVFEGKHASALLNPSELVFELPEADARAQLLAFSLADLKTMARANSLATAVDTKGKSQDEMVDMIYTRARDKISEKRS